MAVMDVGEWHFVQEVPFAYTNDLGRKHHGQGRHGITLAGMEGTLELI